MSPELIENIERFIDGELSRDVLNMFATENNIDRLEEKIDWVRNSRVAVEAEGLKNQLHDLFGQEKAQPAKIRKLGFSRISWAVAASILVLIGGYWMINTSSSDDNLFAQFEYKDAGLPVVMGQSKDYQFDDAMTYFIEENYTVAENKFSQIGNPSDTVIYYLGASQFYSGNSEAANKNLTMVASNINSGFQEKSEWLLLLNALKAKNIESVNLLGSKIVSNPNHRFYTEANDLLSKISKQ